MIEQFFTNLIFVGCDYPSEIGVLATVPGSILCLPPEEVKVSTHFWKKLTKSKACGQANFLGMTTTRDLQ